MAVLKNPANSAPTKKKKAVGLLGWVGRGLLLILALGIFILVVIRWKVTSPPKFYVERLANSELLAVDSKDDLEAKMLDFRNQARKVGTWQGTFTEDSINRWFAIDLPKKFSSSLPPNVNNPRIALSDGRCQIGITVSTFFATGVVWIDGRIERSQEPNSFVVQIDDLRYGTLPIPLAYVEKQISAALSRQKITCSWVDGPKGRVLILNFPPVLSSTEKTFALVDNVEFNAAQFRIVVTTRFRDQ
jgi:hypothetical protein